jgi:hypothetical protein
MSKRNLLKKIAALSLCVCTITPFAACDALGNIFPSMNSSTQENTMSPYTLELFAEETVSLVHPAVNMYLAADPDTLVSDFLPGGEYRYDWGKPFIIEYLVSSSNGDVPDVKRIKLEFSLEEDFSKVEHTEMFSGGQQELQTYNLLPGKTYYYRVSATMVNGHTLYETGSVQTKESPRMMHIDGASNVRDIGGWKTENGKTIKYGMLYRGSEIDGGKNTAHADFCLTDFGIKQMRELGIKTDFDLRSESVKVSDHSILGEDVARHFYDAAQYQSILLPLNAEKTRKIFSDLANPAAYPAYLHCTHGVDRAGSTVLILEALLGVSKVDLVRDYELSAFYHNYKHVNRNIITGGNVLELIDRLDKYDGDSFAEKTANFLLSIGVTQKEIDTLREIFLQ